MVEFALVGPLVLLLLLLVLDFGRGFFFYTQMSAGAREAARNAVLVSNAFSNTASPVGCSGACQTVAVMSQVNSLSAFGFPVVYSDSPSTDEPPSYATCSGGSATTPARCNLKPAAANDRVYVIIYQFGPNTQNPANGPRFASPSIDPNVRTGSHDRVVVDLKMKFQPVTLTLAGLGFNLVFDSQTVEREEF